jgi:hypothetical protein
MARCDQEGHIPVKSIGLIGFRVATPNRRGDGADRGTVSAVQRPRPDLEAVWADRRIDAFDGLCPQAAPSSAPE